MSSKKCQLASAGGSLTPTGLGGDKSSLPSPPFDPSRLFRSPTGGNKVPPGVFGSSASPNFSQLLTQLRYQSLLNSHSSGYLTGLFPPLPYPNPLTSLYCANQLGQEFLKSQLNSFMTGSQSSLISQSYPSPNFNLSSTTSDTADESDKTVADKNSKDSKVDITSTSGENHDERNESEMLAEDKKTDEMNRNDQVKSESPTLSNCSGDEWKPLRSRSYLSDEKISLLQGHFRRNPFPSKYELSALAEQIGVAKRVVQVRDRFELNG